MKGRHWLLFCVLGLCAVASIASCKELNPEYCATHTDSDCPPPGGMCETNDDCASEETPICGPAQTCVQCLADDDCSPAKPFCDEMNTCVGCKVNADCTDSNLCLPDGTCAPSEDVLYVGGTTPAPSANTMCSKVMPCQTLSQALAAMPARRIVRISGMVTDTEMASIDARQVDIYGVDDASIDRTGNGRVLEIRRASNVRIFDLKILGASAMGSGVEIKDDPGPVVSMDRVQVLNHRGPGVLISLGTLAVVDSLIFNNDMDGIRSTGGSLQIKKSRIRGNRGTAGVVTAGVSDVLIESSVISNNPCTSGGVSIMNTVTATIRNTIITGNGQTGNTVGGLRMEATSGVVEFSTISDNIALNDLGVICLGGATMSNNIFSLNGVSGSCSVTYSLTDVAVFGVGNQTGMPQFLDMADSSSTRYFRIGSTSTARDMADPGASLTLDIDGQPRDDARKDMGADEYRP